MSPHSAPSCRTLRASRLLSLAALCLVLGSCASAPPDGSVYARSRTVHGVPIQATAAVDEAYLDIAARVYTHMTSSDALIDLRAAHRDAGFRILLITEEERFLDLPEFAGEGEELEQAGGLGGCIGEFHIALRVGSPHTLVHELGHGIYHSAIQFRESGGAQDEEAWYAERVRAVHGLELEDAFDSLGEEEVHEVLLAAPGTFSADLAAAWRNAAAQGLWEGAYASVEPNEYWAEGVALWFRAWRPDDGDPRELLARQDPALHALCRRVFPETDWKPEDAQAPGTEPVPFEDEPETWPEEDGPELLGGCILAEPLGEVPADPRQVGDVVPSDDFAPFTKQLMASGVLLVVEQSVPDGFVRRVGRTIEEMLAPGDGIDAELQDDVIAALHSYRATLPVPRDERSLDRLFDDHEPRWIERHSVCDIIMAEVPEGQVMEVLEHVLHTVTDVGLHHRFPAEWGISRESELWHAMQRAIDAGFYDVSSYDDLGDAPREVRDRVLMQEFAYWFLTTAWDLQRPYGPQEDEWTLRDPAELARAMPTFFAVFERSAGRVLKAPSRATLAGFGPTRQEERGR